MKRKTMSKFHPTMSRRDFMKGLGLAAGAFGTAAAAGSLPFRDLDDMKAAEAGPIHKLPWWVKENDFGVISSPIDWSKVSRFDQRNFEQCSFQGAVQNARRIDEREGMGHYASVRAAQEEEKAAAIIAGDPWWGGKAYAIAGCVGYGSSMDPADGFTPPSGTPLTQRGGSYTGTPEENSQMMKAVMRWFGAADVSFHILDDKYINFICAYDFHDGKKYEWEDVDQPYETGEKFTSKWRTPPPTELGKRVIPKKAMYSMNFSLQLAMEPSRLGFGDRRYGDGRAIQRKTQKFLHQLGYIACGPVNYTNNFSENVAFATTGGQTEQARHNFSISPRFGSVLGVGASIVTDLPLAPTKPIDAGIHRFCRTCRKCAELCPSGAISRQGLGPDAPIVVDANWDTIGPNMRWDQRSAFEARNPDIVVGLPGQDQEPFYANWWYLPSDCGMGRNYCGSFACANRCVFAKHTDAIVHDVVLATVGTTPIFNGFFREMDDLFGYADGKNVRNTYGPNSDFVADLHQAFFENRVGVGSDSYGINSTK
jgi:reductive dehalogenase